MIIDVMDLNFSSINISSGYDYAREKRGRKIYNREGIDIESVEKLTGDNYQIVANVEGQFGYYKVEMTLEGEKATFYRCECEDYKAGSGVCKHILATCMELVMPHRPSTPKGIKKFKEMQEKRKEEERKAYEQKLKEEEERREYQRKYYNGLCTIESYKNQTITLDESRTNFLNVNELYERVKLNDKKNNKQQIELATDIKFDVKIEIEDKSVVSLNLKIGQTKMYVLKNLMSLYNAYLSEEIVFYGKKLNFIPKRECFAKEEDRKLFDFIMSYCQMIKYNQRLMERYYYSNISDKNLDLIDEKIDEFFELIKDRESIILSKYQGEEKYKYTDEKLDLKLNVEKNSPNDYSINTNLKNFKYILGSKKIYIFHKNKIYYLNKSDNNDLINVLDYLENDEEILIPKDKLNEFSTFVLPKITNYLEMNCLNEELAKEGLVVNKLSSKIYLDLDDNGNIILKLKFCYLDYEFNVLENDYEQYIYQNNITRNIPEEKEVLTRIFQDGFQPVNNQTYFMLKDIDETYQFLSEKIDGYMNDFEVLATDKFKTKKIRDPKISSIGIKLDSSLLELDISNLNIDFEEIKNVLKNYQVRKKYYKLKNGDFLRLDKNENLDILNDISNTFDITYDKLENGIVELPVNRSIYLEKILNKNNNITTTQNDEFTKLINNVGNKKFSDNIVINSKFENVLRTYQKTGYKWLKTLENYGFGGILADDMGLGKTLQVITLLVSNLENKKRKTSIVVSPSSLTLNWKAEINKWCDELNVLVISGTAENRQNLIKDLDKYDLIITSYDSLKRDIEFYENKNFKYIIADEAQYIKNFSTQNATALKKLNGECKFALTGTPIENSISELWSIFDFIMPGYLYSYSKFKKKFELPILKDEDIEATNRLKALISPFILRRIKKDVLTELPEKNVTVMKNEMTEEQEKIYLSYFSQTKKEVAEQLKENGFEKSKFKILLLLTRLRQICCHPELFIENYHGGSGKLNQCLDIIEDAIEAGHKILLFSSYTSMFEILEKELKRRNINYYILTGGTKVDTRVEMVENFNKDDDVKVFLISLKAGGTGLNLTSADVVIHYDPWWNVSSENQATDRAYRMGQKNSVQVYKLITTNSIEEKINDLQDKKAQISENLLSTEEKFISKLSKEEIMNLFE